MASNHNDSGTQPYIDDLEQDCSISNCGDSAVLH